MTDAEKKPIKTKESNAKKPEKKAAHKKARPSSAGFNTLIFFTAIAIFGALYLLWENQQKISIREQITTQRIDQEIATLKEQQLMVTTQNEEQIKNIHSFQENLRPF